jgi:hypothetical protein
MKKIITFIIAFAVLFSVNFALAQEKPLIIKGLYIGMNVNDARNIMEQLLGKDWKISPVSDTKSILRDYRFGEAKLFGKKEFMTPVDPIDDEYGFVIIDHYDSYEGFIGADKGTGKVIRLSFSGKITDIIFSTSKITAEDFAPSFWNNYNMPEFSWVAHGWLYASPKGYTVIIMNDKLLDIKKDKQIDVEKEENKPKQNIKFN